MSLYNGNQNFKTGHFVDFKTHSGKWFYSKVISTRNDEIQLEYMTCKSIVRPNYRRCWIDTELRCINLKSTKLICISMT